MKFTNLDLFLTIYSTQLNRFNQIQRLPLKTILYIILFIYCAFVLNFHSFCVFILCGFLIIFKKEKTNYLNAFIQLISTNYPATWMIISNVYHEVMI